MCSTDVFLGLLALLFPPIAVWVKRGICSADSIINILLCVLGYIPGLIHAWYIIAKFPEPDYDYEVLRQDAEGGRVTYVVVQPGQHTMTGGPRAPPPGHIIAASPSPSHSPAPAPTSAHAQPKYGATEVASSSAAGPSDENDGGVGSSAGPPPTYAQAVAGDNKIQNQD